jgi:hypothetical protein
VIAAVVLMALFAGLIVLYFALDLEAALPKRR